MLTKLMYKIKSNRINQEFFESLTTGKCFHISFIETQEQSMLKPITDVNDYIESLESQFFKASLLIDTTHFKMFKLERDKSSNDSKVTLAKVPNELQEKLIEYLFQDQEEQE